MTRTASDTTGSGPPAPCARSTSVAVRAGRRSFGGELARELAARAQPELAVDLAEVVFDCLVAEEQSSGRFAVGRAASDGERDLQLLWRQLLGGGRVAASDPLAGGAQLGAAALRPWVGAELLEGV
jgi:hypothetical protein